jgi:hypothetical protein
MGPPASRKIPKHQTQAQAPSRQPTRPAWLDHRAITPAKGSGSDTENNSTPSTARSDNRTPTPMRAIHRPARARREVHASGREAWARQSAGAPAPGLRERAAHTRRSEPRVAGP